MSIRSNNFFRNILFLLIAFYFAQGSLYQVGSIFAKLSLLMVLLISSFYLLKTSLIKSKKSLFYYVWTAFLFLNIIGFAIEGEIDLIKFSELRNILTVFLPFFPFYYFAYKGQLSKENLIYFFIILIPIAVASFYYSRNSIITEQFNSNENVVTNTAYIFVALIPYVFLWASRKVISFLSLTLLLFFIIQGAKRGALITGIGGALVFIYYQLSAINPKRRVQGISLALIGVLTLIFFSYEFYLNNQFLIDRIENIEDGGSGRDVIYMNLINSWYNSDNTLNYLFGFGFLSSIKYSGTGHLAHNDWLELLINFGLLGVFIYFLIFCAAIHFIMRSKLGKEYRFTMLAIIFMGFIQTLFSMYYTSINTVFASILMGYLMGLQHYNQRDDKSK